MANGQQHMCRLLDGNMCRPPSSPLHTRNPRRPSTVELGRSGNRHLEGKRNIAFPWNKSPTSGRPGGFVQERAVGFTLPSRGALDHRRRNDEANFCLFVSFWCRPDEACTIYICCLAVLVRLLAADVAALVEFERVPSEAATGRYILFPAPQSRLGWPLSFTFALSAALAGEGNCAQ